MICKW